MNYSWCVEVEVERVCQVLPRRRMRAVRLPCRVRPSVVVSRGGRGRPAIVARWCVVAEVPVVRVRSAVRRPPAACAPAVGLVAARERARLSRYKLAVASSVNPSSVTAWETGRLRLRPGPWADRLAGVLGVEVGELVAEVGDVL